MRPRQEQRCRADISKEGNPNEGSGALFAAETVGWLCICQERAAVVAEFFSNDEMESMDRPSVLPLH